MSASGLSDVAVGGKLALDHKRERDQKYKWAFGEADPRPGRPSKRPLRVAGSGYVHTIEKDLCFQDVDFQAFTIGKIPRKPNTHFDNDILTSDSSAEEDVKEASAALEPDAGITYSFDAERGPAKGSQILNMALAKAVEKYEVRATEKLVKEEYEVVGKEKEELHDGYMADEDDFELL